MSRTAMITGVSGQDGAYLSRLLFDKGYRVIGVTRTPETAPARLAALGLLNKVEIVGGDIAVQSSIDALIEAFRPDEIYNMAAQSSVAGAIFKPLETAEATGMAPLRLFEAVRTRSPASRVFQATSAQIFGRAPLDTYGPQGPFAPTNLYGAAKLFAQTTAEAYRDAFGLFIACGVLFAHESPLRGEEFLTRKVTRTLAQVKRGEVEALEIGTLDSERDWGYAPDFCEGMWMTLQAERPGSYIFATGQTRTVRNAVEVSARYYGFDLEWRGQGVDEVGVDRHTGQVIVRINSAFFRPFEDKTPIADISLTRSELGWEPRMDFDDMISEMCAAELTD